MKKLRVGIVFDDSLDRNDGVQQYIKALGQELTDLGHSVSFIVGESDPNKTDYAQVYSLAKNVSVKFNANRLTMPLPAKKVAVNKLLEKIQFDVLHIQMPYSPLMAGKVINKASKDTKIVGTFHILPNSMIEKSGNKLLATWQKRQLKKFNKIISVSKAAQQFAYKYYGVRSVVIPNMVDIEKYHPTKQLSDNKIPKVAFVGRFVKRKGILDLTKALVELNSMGIRFEAVLAGDGELKTKVEKIVRSNNLEDKISLPGFVTEQQKVKLLQSADYAVFPSTGGESFGIVLIEAMAAGKPVVIGASNPGYSSVLTDHQDLNLVKPKDYMDIAAKLENLISHPEDVKTLLKWQQKHVLQYDTKNVVQNILDIYQTK